MGEIIALWPDETEKPRWVAKLASLGLSWIVEDTLSPGDFRGYFRTRSEAEIEAARRNSPGPAMNDDDIPF